MLEIGCAAACRGLDSHLLPFLDGSHDRAALVKVAVNIGDGADDCHHRQRHIEAC